MKFILSDMFKLAKRRGIISYNPMQDVVINHNACVPAKKHNDSSRVYLPDEKAKLFDALNHELLRNPDNTDPYAVFLLFKLGLRIGELVALKWSDVDFIDNEIHIHRIETMEYSPDGRSIVKIAEHTKKKSSYGDRFLPLGDYEISIFKRIKAINLRQNYLTDDFIFCDSNGRTNIRSIDNLIRKCCNHAGIEVKSAHDIRRTVASEMFNNGVNVEMIRDFLGHADIKTTYGYIVDNHGKEERNRILLNSLKNLNGLKRTQVS